MDDEEVEVIRRGSSRKLTRSEARWGSDLRPRSGGDRGKRIGVGCGDWRRWSRGGAGREAEFGWEMYGRMEQIRISYLKLLGEVASLRPVRGANLERGVETPTLRTSEVDMLRQEQEERNKKARRLDEPLQERDHARVQDKAEKQAVMLTKFQMDEEHAALAKLQGEIAHL
ncbi:uncharacterized protein A4U43_C02F16870 [Asparagus officinalis]|uniref:Uncharacterized protein n=1 Tax=Asparagus officinalis TaxID=4686 RepID=A0A5P1FNN9_ASPOF|nr:uncharacterized protein A4U43_C02F16870 [Asparagus officinalis]